MNALSGEVKLPVVGEVKKVYVIVGGVVVLGLGVMYARNRKAAASSASSAIDPATGYPTGSPEDLAALQQQQTYAPFPGGDGGSSGGSSGTVGGQVTNGPPFSSNAAWAQYAEAQLSAIANGPAPADVAAALGLYLAGQPVTADQRHIIEQAIAFSDHVPVAGPNGFPPSINQSVPSTGPNPPPPTQFPPPAGSAEWTTHTTVHEGEHLAQVLAYGGGMSQADFELHNPGITGYYRPFVVGRGYVSAGTPGAIIALNTRRDLPVLVRTGGWS